MRIVVTVAHETEPTAIDHLGVRQGLDWLGWDYLLIDPKAGMDAMADSIVAFRPDLVLYYMDNTLKAGIPKEVREKYDCKQAFWQMDYRPRRMDYDGQWRDWKGMAPYLDHIFLSNRGQIEWWREEWGLPVTYLPHGSWVPDRPVFDSDERYPCVFMGAMNGQWPYNARKELIEEIMEGTEITVINAGGDERNDNWTRMPAIYHSSDCVLDVSHFWDDPGYASGRYFYSAGLGGACVTKRFPRCEELYPQGTKLYFDTPNEAVESIERLQKDAKLRQGTKDAAYGHNKEHHNFKLRFEEICRAMES